MNLHEDVKLFFYENSKDVIWDDFEDTYSGHGRVEIRNCTATSDIQWLKELYSGWENLKSIAMMKSLRINKKTGKQGSDIRYYISSLNPSCGLANEVKLRNAGLFRLHGI